MNLIDKMEKGELFIGALNVAIVTACWYKYTFLNNKN